LVIPKILTLIFYSMFLIIFVGLGYILYALASWYRDAEENSKQLLAEVLTYTESTRFAVSSTMTGGQDAPPFLTVDFENLLKRNEDVVGWLRISSADIDMPIVQTTDNEFYLDHDLDKRPNELGWVFT
jgi:sortase B